MPASASFLSYLAALYAGPAEMARMKHDASKIRDMRTMVYRIWILKKARIKFEISGINLGLKYESRTLLALFVQIIKETNSKILVDSISWKL